MSIILGLVPYYPLLIPGNLIPLPQAMCLRTNPLYEIWPDFGIFLPMLKFQS